MRSLRRFCATNLLLSASLAFSQMGVEVGTLTTPTNLTALEETPGPDRRSHLERLKDPAAAVRRNAALFLGAEKNKTAVPALIALLKDESSQVKRAAIQALSQIADKRAVPALIQSLQENDYGVRLDAVEALNSLRDPSALPALRRALRDPLPRLRESALNAVANISVSTVTHADIFKALSDDAEAVRVAACGHVIRLKLRGAVSSLLKNIGEYNSPIVREASIRALAVVGDAAVIPSLEKLRQDQEPSVAQAAAEAILKLKTAPTKRPTTSSAPAPRRRKR